MGITFRSGDCHRFVRLGGRTIKDGEAAAVWDSNGRHTEIIGPKRIFLWYSTIRFLNRFKAEGDQYLVVRHRDGTVEHIRGPVQMYLNPSYHDRIDVKSGIKLKENDVIRVCHLPRWQRQDVVESNMDGSKTDESQETATAKPKPSKRFVYGPSLFIPTEDEQVEDFFWTGLPKELEGVGVAQSKHESNPFTTIQLHTKRVWNVKVPIGRESSKVYASLAITYMIDSIDKVTMHKDPCASICVALIGDIHDLFHDTGASNQTPQPLDFESLRVHVIQKASGSKSFPNLIGTGEEIGFSIESVQAMEVAPGTQLKRQLAEAHEREMRSKAQVANKEREIQFQDLELEERQKKAENEAALARKEAQMEAEMAKELHQQKMTALDQELALNKREQEVKIGSWRASDEVILDFLGNLKELGVDMSKFMCTDVGRKTTKLIMQRAPTLQVAVNEDKTPNFFEVEENGAWFQKQD